MRFAASLPWTGPLQPRFPGLPHRKRVPGPPACRASSRFIVGAGAHPVILQAIEDSHISDFSMSLNSSKSLAQEHGPCRPDLDLDRHTDRQLRRLSNSRLVDGFSSKPAGSLLYLATCHATFVGSEPRVLRLTHAFCADTFRRCLWDSLGRLVLALT